MPGRDDQAGRLHALLRCQPGTELLLSAERSVQAGAGTPPMPLTNFFTGKLINNDTSTDSVRAQFTHDLPFAGLTCQLGWIHQNVDPFNLGIFLLCPFYNPGNGNNRQLSNELRVLPPRAPAPSGAQVG